MRRHAIRHLLVIVSLGVLLGAGVTTLHLSALADDNTPVSLNQAVNPLLQHAQFTQAASGSQLLDLSVGLQVQNASALDSMLQSIYDPQSPLYGRYLSPTQFKQLFAPADAQVQQVTSFLQSNGCSVTGVAADNLLIDASCHVSQAQQAFGAQINIYKNGKQTFFANSSALKIPKRLKKLIASINGLDSSKKFHPLYSQKQQRPAVGSSPVGYGPPALSNAYDFTPLQSAGISGDNQSVAFLELDGFQQSDINTYYQAYNLNHSQNASGNTLATPNITTIKVKNARGIPGESVIEPTLDLEVLLGLAPHANALVYEGADSFTPSFNDVLSQIVNDNRAQIVSISWEAECESDASLRGEWQTVDNILKQGAAQGMSFFAASGDAGAYDCKDTNLQVGVPASDPYVTSVGGTTLSLNADNTYKSEMGWSDILDNLHGEMGSGSGGGISSYWPMPFWQRGPGVINTYSSSKPCGAGKYCRQVPDVAANADEGNANPATADAVYCTVCTLSGWQRVGGTSAAAPIWAAAAVLINQYLQSQGKPHMGLASPTLYSLFNSQTLYPPFHDVTTGTTNPPAAFSGVSILNPKVNKSKLTNYRAGPAYDLVTGLGSPDVYNIARDLAATSGKLSA